MIVGAYTPGIVVSQSRPYEHNLDLVASVLQGKQTQFDTAYLGLQKLRKESLNIQFINDKEQGKVDAFNQKMDQFFQNTEEFGDLSNNSLLTRYTSLFNEIGQDSSLISRFQKEKEYRKELQAVEQKRLSKDPQKAGFHPINYQNYLSRIQAYKDADLDTQEVSVAPYTDYVDLQGEMLKLIKEVPTEKFVREEQLGNGYVVKKTYAGRNPEKVNAIISSFLKGKGATQLREEAEFTMRNMGEQERSLLYSLHAQRVDEQIQNLDSQIDKAKEDMVGLIGDELTQATQKAQQLMDARTSLQSQVYDEDEFSRMADKDMLQLMVGMQAQDVQRSMSNTYGGYAVSQEIEPDIAFLRLQDYQLSLNKFRVDTQFKQARLSIDQQELSIKQAKARQESIQSDPNTSTIEFLQTADPTRLNEDVTYKALEGMVMNLSTSLKNPFLTSPDGKMSVDEGYQHVPEEIWRNNKEPRSLSNNPYVVAYGMLLAEGKRMGKSKEAAMRYAHANVERVFNNPRNEREINVYNQLQDTLGNQRKLAELMETASKSGDPTAYMEQLPTAMALQYRRVLVDPEVWGDKRQKDGAKNYRAKISSEVTNVIDLDSPNNRQFEGMNYVQRIDPLLIKEIEVRPNGDVELHMDPEASLGPRGDVGDNNYRPAGPLHNGYYSYIDENGITQHQPIENNIIRANVPSRSILNAHTRLGLSVGMTPTNYKVWSNRGPVDYQIVKDTDGSYLYRIIGITEQYDGADSQGWIRTTSSPEEIKEAINSRINKVIQ